MTKITVHAGRTFNHPYESYSNLRPSVTLEATLDKGENAEDATRSLQSKAEELVKSHKRNLLDSLEQIHELEMVSNEVRSLEDQITKNQSRLSNLQGKMAVLKHDQQEDSDDDEIDLTAEDESE